MTERSPRPRQVSYAIANIAPQGHAPWLRRLLSSAKEDPAEGARPLPWLTPKLVPEVITLTWISTGNTWTLCPNRNLSFCPGAIIDGESQPFVVASGDMHAHLCQTLLLSIADPRVCHSALHSGSDSLNEFGLNTFPMSALQQLVVAP